VGKVRKRASHKGYNELLSWDLSKLVYTLRFKIRLNRCGITYFFPRLPVVQNE
jgi:hypothetical protein